MSATDFRLDSACLPLHRLAAFEQTILDGVQDLLLVLAPDGRVLHVSPMCFALTTLTPEHLLGNYIASFMHYDDMPVFLAEFQASMAAGSPWRFHHRLRRTDGTFAIFESTFNPFFDKTSTQPAACFGLNKCVMTLRPYSNPSVVLMDSYLDHFTTNARLMERLKQLRSEIEDSDEEVDEGEEVVQKIEVCVPIPIKAKTKINSHPSDEFLRKAIQNSALNSNRHLQDGASVKLEKAPGSGDIGIQIAASRLEMIEKTGSWAAKPCQTKKRKNAKVCDHLCTECGTKDSPEWRTGSQGKKSLCNACGLRWAKASKREALDCASTAVSCASQALECMN